MHAVFLHVEHGAGGGGAHAGVCRGGAGAVAAAGFVAVTVTVAARVAGAVVGAVAGVRAVVPSAGCSSKSNGRAAKGLGLHGMQRLKFHSKDVFSNCPARTASLYIYTVPPRAT